MSEYIDPIQRVIDWQARCRWSFGKVIPQGNTAGENYVEERIVEALDEVMHNLSPRDYKIFGMHMDGWTQEEIGLTFGVTHQRVSQIIKKIQRVVAENPT